MTFIEIAGTNATLTHMHIIISMIGFSIILYISTLIYIIKALKRKNGEMKLMQQQHIAKIDAIRRENIDISERVRLEMLKKEEERGRQWMESEKETLHVLNGVSQLLDLNDRIGKAESEKILLKLDEIREKVEKITPSS